MSYPLPVTCVLPSIRVLSLTFDQIRRLLLSRIITSLEYRVEFTQSLSEELFHASRGSDHTIWSLCLRTTTLLRSILGDRALSLLEVHGLGDQGHFASVT